MKPQLDFWIFLIIGNLGLDVYYERDSYKKSVYYMLR